MDLHQQPGCTVQPHTTHHLHHQLFHQHQQQHHQLHLQHMQLSPNSTDGAATSSNNSSVGQLAAEEDIGPMPRDRCNTWPMRRPTENPQTSPMIQEEIPEEDPDLYDSSENIGRLGATSAASNGLMHSPDGSATFSPGMSSPGLLGVSPPDGSSMRTDASNGDLTSGGGSNGKKSTTRRNAWGNMSYADLITQAIIQSPEQRLTLAQVYEWMVQNVAYFRDKGDSNSSAGWKNSIRHNLSLHSRFMRIQNEGAGKSSWWVINPDAKPGRNPRRTRDRANTIDTSTKGVLLDKKKGQRKKLMKDMRGIMGSVNCMNGSQASIVSRDLYDDDSMNNGSFEPFRGRTQSNLSVPGSSARVSPNYEELEFPAWVDLSSGGVNPLPSDIVDGTNQMQLGMNGQSKHEQKATVKTEPVVPPPSYHELNSVRGSNTQNPLLRTPIIQPGKFIQPGMQYGMPFASWSPSMTSIQPQSCGAAAHHHHHNSAAITQSIDGQLPIDLVDLTLPTQPLMGVDVDMESLIRHELNQTNNQLSFDL